MITRNPANTHDDLLSRLRSAGVSKQVASAIMRVPRDRFVPRSQENRAWLDESLPIGEGQTISQPSLVGRMIDQLSIGSEDTVLDVGTGSGYQAAVLSLLVRSVISVERITKLREKAEKLLLELGYRNITVLPAEETLGWEAEAPYDGIIVGAASPEVPEPLVQQLKVGGRLVIPVGNRFEQQVVVVQRTDSGVKERRLDYVRFVPLIGQDAWRS